MFYSIQLYNIPVQYNWWTISTSTTRDPFATLLSAGNVWLRSRDQVQSLQTRRKRKNKLLQSVPIGYHEKEAISTCPISIQ